MVFSKTMALIALVLVLGLLGGGEPSGPPGARDELPIMGEISMKEATFGAGCFWGVEAAFRKVHGVQTTEVGFMGGDVEDPSYERVCRGDTGHAEVVHLRYDPEEVSYAELLDVFFDIHDPTQRGRQGPDVGYQYRSVIFYYGEEQREAAERKVRERDDSIGSGRSVATSVEPAEEFYRAEDYHQQYYQKQGRSCRLM